MDHDSDAGTLGLAPSHTLPPSLSDTGELASLLSIVYATTDFPELQQLSSGGPKNGRPEKAAVVCLPPPRAGQHSRVHTSRQTPGTQNEMAPKSKSSVLCLKSSLSHEAPTV